MPPRNERIAQREVELPLGLLAAVTLQAVRRQQPTDLRLEDFQPVGHPLGMIGRERGLGIELLLSGWLRGRRLGRRGKGRGRGGKDEHLHDEQRCRKPSWRDGRGVERVATMHEIA